MPKSAEQLALDQMVQALQPPPLPMPDPRKAVPLPTPDPRTWADRLPRIQGRENDYYPEMAIRPPNMNPEYGDIGGNAITPDWRMIIPVDDLIRSLGQTGKNI